MFKKIFLSICLIAIIAYLSLWAWAVHWIDEDKNIVDFVSDEKNITLETAKLIWQITPAINREKDAQRLLKMAEWSAYTDLTHNITMLKNNYNMISQYHQKHENKLNEPLKSRFILQKLIFMNRSLNEIEDKEFEKEIANIIENYSFYGKDNLETRVDWIQEFIWFVFFHRNTIYDDVNLYRSTLKNYGDYFKNDITFMNEKYNTNFFDIIKLYYYSSFECYNYEAHRYVGKKSTLLKADKLGKDVFQMLQEKIIEVNKKDFEFMNKFSNKWIEKNSNYLIIFQIIFFDKNSECRKEAINFLSKMNEMANVLGKESVISKSLQSDLLSKQVFD